MNNSAQSKILLSSPERPTTTPDNKSVPRTEDSDINSLTPAKDQHDLPHSPTSKRRAGVINKRIIKEIGSRKSKKVKSKASTRDINLESNNSTANVYTDALKKSLEEAFQENDKLRDRVQELEALLAAAQDEMEKRDRAILELAQNLEGGS